jgi:hypothetical protein
MRTFLLFAGLGLLLTASTTRAEFHPEARRAYEEHWRAHPEHADEMIRVWHQRLFHHEIAAPLLRRWAGELREGVTASVAFTHILCSPEYYHSCGDRPEGFVRHTFVEIVGRQPTESEYRFWLNRLYHTDRSVVAGEIVARYPPAWIAEPAVVEHYEYRPPPLPYRH